MSAELRIAETPRRRPLRVAPESHETKSESDNELVRYALNLVRMNTVKRIQATQSSGNSLEVPTEKVLLRNQNALTEINIDGAEIIKTALNVDELMALRILEGHRDYIHQHDKEGFVETVVSNLRFPRGAMLKDRTKVLTLLRNSRQTIYDQIQPASRANPRYLDPKRTTEDIVMKLRELSDGLSDLIIYIQTRNGDTSENHLRPHPFWGNTPIPKDLVEFGRSGQPSIERIVINDRAVELEEARAAIEREIRQEPVNLRIA